MNVQGDVFGHGRRCFDSRYFEFDGFAECFECAGDVAFIVVAYITMAYTSSAQLWP